MLNLSQHKVFIDDYENTTDMIVIDTETVTDQATNISKVWEIGLLVIKDSEIVDRREWLVCPTATFDRLDIFYPEDHIDVQTIKSSPNFSDIMHELEQYIHPDFVICGHNIDYDLRVINYELDKLKKPLIGSKKVDTIRMARKLFPEWGKYNLDKLASFYGLNIEKRHRALDDAEATAIAYLKMREKIINDRKNRVEELSLF